MARTSAKPSPQKQMVQVQYRPLSALKKHPKNPRTIKDTSFKKLVTSIRENPDYFEARPIILSDRTGELIIIAGNQRFEAARDIGIKDVPTALLPELTEEKEREIMIRDNIANGDWDWDMLANEWDADDLIDWGVDLPDDWGADSGAGNAGETDPDDVPEPAENPVSELGDLWILGNHRLLCGDSTDKPTVDRLMNGQKADICFTSPPYNAGSLNVKGNKTTGKKYNSFDDNQTEVEFFDFLTANMGCMLASADEVFYNIGLVQDNKRAIFKLVDAFGDTFKDVIYWKKKTVAPHIQKGVINNLVEFILCFGDGKRKFANPQFGQGTYWNVIEGANASGNEYSEIHKATFPVYLPENIITNFTKINAVVIDCFGGTGTTLIACEKTARYCRMMELDPKYCDVIINRWQNFTGEKAVLESTGETFEEVKNGRAS